MSRRFRFGTKVNGVEGIEILATRSDINVVSEILMGVLNGDDSGLLFTLTNIENPIEVNCAVVRLDFSTPDTCGLELKTVNDNPVKIALTSKYDAGFEILMYGAEPANPRGIFCLTEKTPQGGSTLLEYESGFNLNSNLNINGYFKMLYYEAVTKQNIVVSPITISAPTGTVIDYVNLVPPTGWLKCSGGLVSKIDYPNLFDVCGYKFGSGSYGFSFGIPSLTSSIDQSIKIIKY